VEASFVVQLPRQRDGRGAFAGEPGRGKREGTRWVADHVTQRVALGVFLFLTGGDPFRAVHDADQAGQTATYEARCVRAVASVAEMPNGLRPELVDAPYVRHRARDGPPSRQDSGRQPLELILPEQAIRATLGRLDDGAVSRVGDRSPRATTAGDAEQVQLPLGRTTAAGEVEHPEEVRAFQPFLIGHARSLDGTPAS